MGLDIYFEKRNRNADIETFNAKCDEKEGLYGKVKFEIYSPLLKLNNGEITKDEFDKRIKEGGFTEEDVENAKKFNVLDKWIDDNNPRRLIAYFRKVNFLIHFFNYEDNVSYIEISKYEIEELIERCDKIISETSETKKQKLAEELLPTESGFCFGSTEYDERYFSDVKEVRDTFKRLLEEVDWDNEIVEMYCWW